MKEDHKYNTQCIKDLEWLFADLMNQMRMACASHQNLPTTLIELPWDLNCKLTPPIVSLGFKNRTNTTNRIALDLICIKQTPLMDLPWDLTLETPLIEPQDLICIYLTPMKLIIPKPTTTT